MLFKKTLCVAESLTGGKLADHFISIPGASSFFKGGVIAYTNDIKEKVLGVDKFLLISEGAVHQDVAYEMAKGVKEKFGTDYSIATTGFAGPKVDIHDKTVGHVFIAVVSDSKSKVQEFWFDSDLSREEIREKTVIEAVKLFEEFVK